mmetsp:Transcript_26489/g.41310  ORF Transcript_26489/g.41310 Transcript_26489/m.41310 type:complete len:146 (-) Transcript_26489:141-578(-)
MDGLSFSDFENSSIQSLYSRGFAGAQEMDKAAKNLPQGDFAMRIDNGRPAFQAISPSLQFPQAQSLQSQPRAQVSSTIKQPLPLNDMTMMPGNTRISHSNANWMPSREADAVARNSAVTTQALPAPTPAPANGGQRGAFVNWKSN